LARKPQCLFPQDFHICGNGRPPRLPIFWSDGPKQGPGPWEKFTGMTAWEKILERMERRVNPHSFSTWFRPTRQEGAENGKIVVRVPSKLFKKRLTETYGQYLQAVLAELDMADTQIDFL